MVIDTSALVAILGQEGDARVLADRIEDDPVRLLSAATYVEATIVVAARSGDRGLRELERLLALIGAEIMPVTEAQAREAAGTHRRFGRGRHPARLNFGDCFAYALAMETGEPLLFKGDDFARTDVAPVL